MEKCKILVVLIFLGPIHTITYAQEASIIFNDSLNYFLARKDFDAFIKKVSIISDTAYKQKDSKYLIHLGNKLDQDFGDLTAVQKKQLRIKATHLAQNIFNLTGNLDESLAVYLIAHEQVDNKQVLDSIAWYVENRIANLYTRKGDYDRADYFSQLLETSLIHFQLTELLTRFYTNLGRNLMSQFRPEEAIESFHKGYYLADSIQYTKGVFSNALNLVEVYVELPEYSLAYPFLIKASESLKHLESDKKYLEMRSELEFQNARYLIRELKYGESIERFKNSIQTLKEFHISSSRREFAKSYAALANAYLLTDSLEKAKAALDQGFLCLIPEFTNSNELPDEINLYPENSFIDLFQVQIQFYIAQFEQTDDIHFLRNAISATNLALLVNDLIIETILSDPSKLTAIRNNKDLVGRGIELTYKLYEASPDTDILEIARTFFNRSKSVLYREKTVRSYIIEYLSPEDKLKWHIFNDSIIILYRIKLEATDNANKINGQILLLQDRIDQLLRPYENKVLLQFKTPDTYIEYVVTEDTIFVLAEINRQKVFKKIGHHTILDELLYRLNKYILDKGYSPEGDILNELYSFLVLPITSKIPEKIIIIPDESIGNVPFEILKDSSGHFLIDHATISYAFEYKTLDIHYEYQKEASPIFCLAPQYDKREIKVDEESRGSVYHLPFAKMEVDSIQAVYYGEANVSQSGDKNEWQDNVSRTRIFHFAGHAIINKDQSYLALTSVDIEKDQLTSKEIALLKLSLDLVVLSACETGRGNIEHGEGVRSLGRSFMESGAKATIISLWTVNDKATSDIMVLFYKYLREGVAKDQALRLSKLDYIHKATKRNAHPYFWGAFIPAGNMNSL